MPPFLFFNLSENMNKVLLLSGMLLMCPLALYANDKSHVLSDLPNAIIEDDLRYKTTKFLGELRTNVEKRKNYIDRLYSLNRLEAMATASELLENPQVRAELLIAREAVLMNALLKEKLIDVETDIEDLAKERYKTNKDKYKSRRSIRLSQIFIKKQPDATAAKQKIQKILDELKDGQEEKNLSLVFSGLARKHSDDKHAGTGGEFGKWLIEPSDDEKKKNLHPVVKAAFELSKANQISDIVESDMGFHILLLSADRPAIQQSFELVREQLMQEIGSELLKTKRTELKKSLLPGADEEIDDAVFLELLNKAATNKDKK